MKKFVPFIILFGICLIFFYKTFLLGQLPFPGDLLVSGYAPWRHESYVGYVAGAIPSKDQYFDVLRELYPWKTLVIGELKQGKFPLWNPYNFSGAPLLANYQSQVFYPFTFIYFLLPQDIAWTIMVIIQPMLGSVFMYLFATEIGISSAGAILAAILFNFSGFANVWMEFTTVWHTILWLPLILFLVEKSVKNKYLTLPQQLLFIFGLYCAITGGHPQDFINSFLFLCIYTILRKAPVSLLFVFTIPFFIAAVQLFPTIELFRHSARVAHDYQGIIQTMLVQWWQLPLLAIADFFGNPATKTNITGDYVGKTLSIGIVGFLLALSSLKSISSSWHKKFFTGSAFVILLLTVRTPISELLYRYPWPILSTGTPTRNLFILLFSMSMLAGFGFDALKYSKRFFIAVWVVCALLWIKAPVQRAMILATVILSAATIIIIAAKKKKILLFALIPLAAFELFYGFIKFNPFVPRTFVYPANKLIDTLRPIASVNRFWAYGTGEIEANFATQTGLYSPDGTDPLNLSWYNRFIQSSREGNIAVTFNRTTRSDAKIATGYGAEDLPNNTFRLRVMDALGVKYVLDRSENPQNAHTFALDRFKLITKVDEWRIYENLKSAPRFFVTSDIRSYSDAKSFEDQFFGESFDPAKTVLLETNDWNTLPKFTESYAIVNLLRYTPSSVELQVFADAPAFLFLSDTYDSGWTATVNGKPTKVYKANFAFRGIVVPAGESTVIFSYQPRSFTTGLAISGIAIFMTVCYFVYQYKTRSEN